ncbi:MAG: hypothetical protein RL134_946 [Actinomycetota bacterium]|jgi:hypothetical protein
MSRAVPAVAAVVCGILLLVLIGVIRSATKAGNTEKAANLRKVATALAVLLAGSLLWLALAN